jgi:hypothetical protein
MSYLIFDKDYGIYTSPFVSGYLRAQCKRGNLSIINTRNLTGMNIDGHWVDLPIWEHPIQKVAEEPLISIEASEQQQLED